jgi:major membrane immunogen (membrane-anchored lipoprotein)
MKRILFAILLAFLAIACGNNDRSIPAGASSGTGSKAPALDLSKFKLTNVPGTDLQKAQMRSEDGLILEEGLVRNGKRFGAWVVYQPKKEIPLSITNFIDDNYAGVFTQYNQSGQIELLCGYSDNKLDGFFARYRNGRKTEEGIYKNGVYDGVYKKYYDGKEIAQQEVSYKDGKMDGITRFYDETGNLIMEYEYKNGEKIKGGIVEPTAKQE